VDETVNLGLGSKLRYFITLLLGCVVSMAVSYGVVRYLSQGLTHDPVPESAEVRDAEQLRQFSNALLRLTAEYLNHLPQNVQAPSHGFRTWLEQDFRPRLNNLRRQMAGAPVSGEALTRLLAAADGVAKMTTHPAQGDLQREVLRKVREAAVAVEAQIAAVRADLYLSQPPLMPGF